MRKPNHKNEKSTQGSPQDQLIMQRRAFLQNALIGGLGYGAFSFLKHRGMSQVGAFVRESLARSGMQPLNAIDVINDALRGGPSLLNIGQAMAADASKPAVFHVFYRTSHDIRNELYLGDYGNQYLQFGNGSVSPGAMTGLAKSMHEQAPAPLNRLNKWAYDIFTTGKIDATTAFGASPTKAALTPAELKNVSVIAAVGMPGSQGVHQNAVIPGSGNLEYVMQQSFSNYSPVGSVLIDGNGYDGSGAVQIPARSVKEFLGAIAVPGTYMSREREANPVELFDDLTGSPAVTAVRAQMLDAHKLLKEQLSKIQQYGPVADASFMTYGARKMNGLAGMMMFADLFSAKLAYIGGCGLNSFDFHATDALRTPTGATGNMVTETAQALAGAFYIARAALDSKQDAIIHFSTCSNRSQNWGDDNQHVSTLTFIIKGSGDSCPYVNVPGQQLLIADGAKNMYAEGPGQAPTFSSAEAQKLGMNGAGKVGSLEAGIVESVGKAIGQQPAAMLANPPAKII